MMKHPPSLLHKQRRPKSYAIWAKYQDDEEMLYDRKGDIHQTKSKHLHRFLWNGVRSMFLILLLLKLVLQLRQTKDISVNLGMRKGQSVEESFWENEQSIIQKTIYESVHQERKQIKSEYKIQGLSKTHFLGLTHDSSFDFCSSLLSYIIHDAKPIMITWKSQEADHRFDGFHKILEYLIKETRDNDVVIIVDADRTWLQRPLGEVLDDFKLSKARILLGAEKNCWGLGGDLPQYKVCSGIPSSPMLPGIYGPRTGQEERYTRPRWVHPGTVIGYAKDLKALYTAMVEFISEDELGQKMMHDQAVFLMFFYTGRHNISIDYLSHVIKVMSSSQNDTVFSPYMPEESQHSLKSARKPILQDLRDPDMPPWIIFDHVSKNFPAFLHFNGNSKGLMKDWFSNGVWWTGGIWSGRQDKINNLMNERGGVRLLDQGGAWLDWNTLCSKTIAMKEDRMLDLSDVSANKVQGSVKEDILIQGTLILDRDSTERGKLDDNSDDEDEDEM